MNFTPKLNRLEEKKHKLKIELQHLSNEFHSGEITKDEYVEKKYKLLGGDFEEEAFRKINKEIEKTKSNYRNGAVVAVVILAFMALQMLPGGITGFASLDSQNLTTIPVNNQYDSNATLDLSSVNATSVRVTGSIYGQGEAWIYLVDGGTRKLVHYADTRTSEATGMVTANTTVSETNQSSDNTTEQNTTSINETSNSTKTNTTTNTTDSNVTINQTNSTNTTLNSTNSTINQTNTTTNTTENSTESNFTNAEGGTGQEVFELVTAKDIYELGETVNVTILPEGSTYTLYMHTPSDTELLSGTEWTVTEPGQYRASALITYNNRTERRTKEFDVLTEQPTSTFVQTCTDTCSVESTDLKLEIVVDGVRVALDNVTYSEAEATDETTFTNDTSNQTDNQTTTEETQSPSKTQGKGPSQNAAERAKCLNPNVNLRPESCFTQEELDRKLSGRNFTLVNSLGDRMAIFDARGNMHIRGDVIEQASGEPIQYDFSVANKIWIDAIDKDLYVSGNVYENQETLMWKSRNDYVVTNENGMYLAVFEAKTGDLYLRGEVR